MLAFVCTYYMGHDIGKGNFILLIVSTLYYVNIILIYINHYSSICTYIDLNFSYSCFFVFIRFRHVNH